MTPSIFFLETQKGDIRVFFNNAIKEQYDSLKYAAGRFPGCRLCL